MGYVNPNYPVHLTVEQLLAYRGNCPYSNAVFPYNVYRGYAVYKGRLTAEQLTSSPRDGFMGRLDVGEETYYDYGTEVEAYHYVVGMNFSPGSSSSTLIGIVGKESHTGILKIGDSFRSQGKKTELTLVPFAGVE